MRNLIKVLIFSVAMLFATCAFAQEPAATNVPGLELPPDQSIGFDEGFISIQAKSKGEVKWLITSGVKVKYFIIPQANTVIVSVPPTGGVINVFAVALVDGKLTDFARTTITVGNPSPGPNPGPGPNPNPNPNPGPVVNQKLHLTFLVDMSNVTPDMAKLLNSETMRKGINQRGHWFRLYDLKDPIVVQKKLDQVVQRVGGSAVLVIQSDDGRVLNAVAVPRTEQEVFALIQQITGRP